MNKVDKPFIRERRGSRGSYECSVCFTPFEGPGNRKGLATEFANHVRQKHSGEDAIKAVARNVRESARD